MGLVKTRRLAAMQKQQRAKAGTGSVASVGVLPVLPISKWGLELDIGKALSSVRCLMSEDRGQKTEDKGCRTLDFEAAGRRFSQGEPI